jgi:AbrB family looped-hinge helix DNA binding protein
MRVTSKGQVTIPQAIHNAAGPLPNTEVEVVYENDQVILRAASHKTGGQNWKRPWRVRVPCH